MDVTVGKIREIKIEDEMRSSYLDYAMSVIIARALPDVRMASNRSKTHSIRHARAGYYP
jgi:hypothetical protein